MPTNNSSKWNDKLTDANFPNIQYLAFEIKIFIKKIYVYHKYVRFADLSAEQLQLLIKTKSMAVNRQTDRQTTVVLTIASLTVGTT